MKLFSISRRTLESELDPLVKNPELRAKQLYQGVYQNNAGSIAAIEDIAVDERLVLNKHVKIQDCTPLWVQDSDDGSRKYLFDFGDGAHVESVLIEQPTRHTLCVSSQVGCALGCRFCQTGTMGLARNLTVEEIVQQFVGVRDDAAKRDIVYSNVVFMGMGEPLHNLENVLEAIRIVTDDFGLGLSARRITVSTAGLVPGIECLANSDVDVNLAVSLNATTDRVRSAIMPINTRYSLGELIDALRSMSLRPGKRIVIEYVLMAGVNDSPEDLSRLPQLLDGMAVKINLIPYNENAGLGFEVPDADWIEHWKKNLLSAGFVTTVRWSKGRDIDAACGQLVAQGAA